MSSAEEKAFADLRARFALRAMCLYRSDARDGHVWLFVEAWGVVRSFRSLDLVERLLGVLPETLAEGSTP